MIFTGMSVMMAGASAGAAIGAAVGTVFPVVGTAIGGLAGAAIGAGLGWASPMAFAATRTAVRFVINLFTATKPDQDASESNTRLTAELQHQADHQTASAEAGEIPVPWYFRALAGVLAGGAIGGTVGTIVPGIGTAIGAAFGTFIGPVAVIIAPGVVGFAKYLWNKATNSLFPKANHASDAVSTSIDTCRCRR